MTLSTKRGPCSSCGRMVTGQKNFIGPITYHCLKPEPFGCWPYSLYKMDKIIDQKRKSYLKYLNSIEVLKNISNKSFPQQNVDNSVENQGCYTKKSFLTTKRGNKMKVSKLLKIVNALTKIAKELEREEKVSNKKAVSKVKNAKKRVKKTGQKKGKIVE